MTLKSTIRQIYSHPIGRDIIDKILLQTGKQWVVTNPFVYSIVGRLSLGTLRKVTGKAGTIDALINILDTEFDLPDPTTVVPAKAWWKEAIFYQIYPLTFTAESLGKKDNTINITNITIEDLVEEEEIAETEDTSEAEEAEEEEIAETEDISETEEAEEAEEEEIVEAEDTSEAEEAEEEEIVEIEDTSKAEEEEIAEAEDTSTSIPQIKTIISKLDYLQALGVDAIWLGPVYDSPMDDNGYDIRDYYNILPEYGTMADMDDLIAELKSRGMRLIMDLVINHTSDEHNWFKEALEDENSPYRDYYFFRKTEDGKPPNNWTSFFGGSAWNYYPEQDCWALHLFSKKQMDLNWENEDLRTDIHNMVKWWLDKGIDGFRLDAINHISKTPGLPEGDPFIGRLMGYTGIEHFFYGPNLHTYLRDLKKSVFEPYNAFSVGEASGIGVNGGRLLTDGYRKELDLIFSFDHLETPGHTRFDNYVYNATYLKRFYMKHLNVDNGHGWHSLFFNNHDNPKMISKIDPDGTYTIPLAKMLAVLQCTLRGTPFIYQGDELGITNGTFSSIDDIKDVESLGIYQNLIAKDVPEAEAFKQVLSGTRDHARLPMDWEEARSQELDANSVLSFYRDLIYLRRTAPVLTYGALTFMDQKDNGFLNYTRILSPTGNNFYIEVNLLPKARPSEAPEGSEFHLGNYGTGTRSKLRPYEARIYRC